MSDSNKVIISGRIDPQLKQVILEEAEEMGMSVSAYLEFLLSKRENSLEIGPETGETTVEVEEEPKIEVEEPIEHLNPKEEKDDPYLPLLFFSEEQQEAFKEYLDLLWVEYPDLSKEDIILGSLYASCRNEKSFFQHTIRGYLYKLKKQPFFKN